MVISCCWSRATSPWSSPRNKYIKHVRLDTVGRPVRKEAGRPFLYCIGGKPPSYTVGSYQPVMWFSVHTIGGTRDGPPPHQGEPVPPHVPPPGGAEGPLALSPQQCGAWIENLTARIQNHRTKSNKYLKIPTLKVLLDFFLVRAAHHPCVCGARRAFSAMAAVRLLAIHPVWRRSHTLP